MKPAYDSERLQTLASAVMDGHASPSEQQELSELLRHHVEARDEYLALVDLHANLAIEVASVLPADRQQANDVPATDVSATDVVATADVEQDTAGVSPADKQRGDRVTRTGWKVALDPVGLGAVVLAACLIIALRQFPVGNRPVPAEESFATVVEVTDTELVSGQVAVGDRYGRQSIQLKSGFVRLEFDNGVEVTLQGPAEFELLAAVGASLKSGLLTAVVPPGAEGFTVQTPMVKVVDLGTSFGIDLSEDGVSGVSVFDGEVELAVSDASEKRLLTEGKSVRIGADQQIKEVDFASGRFARAWPTSSGITRATPAFRVLPPWPKKIHHIQNDRRIFVATEGPAVDLVAPLQVDISQPGDYQLVSQLTPERLSADQRVRSYILHFHPFRALGVRRARRVKGAITFDRPVLGVIVQRDQLVASSGRFTWRRAGERQPRRQLNLTGNFDGDQIALSDDRRTLTVDLISPGRSSDLIRVIVDAAVQDAAGQVEK